MNIPIAIKSINSLTLHPGNYNYHPEIQVKELAESLTTFGQFKNIVVWTCPEDMLTDEGYSLQEGVTYILAGHGLWQAAKEAKIDGLEVKDYSHLSYKEALALLLVDNAAPITSEPDSDKLLLLIEQTKEVTIDKPHLQAMLEQLKMKSFQQIDDNFDPYQEWEGMPEFEQEDEIAYTIHVHFTHPDDIAKFSELIGQSITNKTKFIWFPKQEQENLKQYVASEP